MPNRIKKHRANWIRNMGRAWVRWYEGLTAYRRRMRVRCPSHTVNEKGERVPIPEEDVPGCGSRNVSWDGEVYDCHECGLFFSPYSADPPHFRNQDEE